MEYLILGYILMAAGVMSAIKAISFIWQSKIDWKSILVFLCLAANFILFSRGFMTIAQKPEQADIAKNALVNLGILNIIAIVVMAIILQVRKRQSR